MDTKVFNTIEKSQLKNKVVNFNVGDSIAVHNLIDIDKDGKERIQIFKGIVLRIKGSGMAKSFTIRKISHAGIGVEKIFPINSPAVKKIEFLKKGKVRRAKLYYMRGRTGKSALKILEGTMTKKELKELEEAMKEEKMEVAVDATESTGIAEQPADEPAKEEAKQEEVVAEAPKTEEAA